MKSKKVLVVDDEDMIVTAIKKTLEKEGYEVYCASNYTTALQCIEKNLPDVIITDMMMPYTGGFDLIEYIKENPATKAIPVILVTGMDKGILENTLSIADAVIEKPFDVKEIIIQVNKLAG